MYIFRDVAQILYGVQHPDPSEASACEISLFVTLDLDSSRQGSIARLSLLGYGYNQIFLIDGQRSCHRDNLVRVKRPSFALLSKSIC